MAIIAVTFICLYFTKETDEEGKEYGIQIEEVKQLNNEYTKKFVDLTEKITAVEYYYTVNTIYNSEYYLIDNFGISGLNIKLENMGSKIYPNHVHGKGEINSKGLYITGSCFSTSCHCARNGFLYDFANLTIPYKSLEVSQYDLIQCYFRTDNEAYCCSSSGHILKFTIDDEKNISYSIIYEDVNTGDPDKPHWPINTCRDIILNGKNLILLGSGDGKIYVFNETAGLIKVIITPDGGTIKEIGKIREGIIMIVKQRSGTYILDLRKIFEVDPLPTPIRIAGDYIFGSIIPLEMGGEGYFAIAGSIEDRRAGLIQIAQLNADLSINIHKSKGGISGEGCDFRKIKEIKYGTIIIGGDWDCDVVCVWNYIDQDSPKCVLNIPAATYSILDIVSHFNR